MPSAPQRLVVAPGTGPVVDPQGVHGHDREGGRAHDERGGHAAADRGGQRPAPLAERGEEQGDSGEGDERQTPVYPEHDCGDGGDGDEVAEALNDARGEQLVEGVDVRGEAGDHAADRVAVEEGHVLALELAVKLAAQVIHHPLPHRL